MKGTDMDELMDLMAKLAPYTDGLTDGGLELRELLEEAYDLGIEHGRKLGPTAPGSLDTAQ